MHRRAGLERIVSPVAVSLVLLFWSVTALAGVNRWTSRGPEGASILSLAIDPTRPDILYAGTGSYGGGHFANSIIKSIDGGRTWAPSGVGLTTGLIDQILVDPMNPDRLYAKAQAGDGAVFVSTNAGARWEPLVVTLPVYCLAAGRGATQTVLYAGTAQRHPEEHGRRRELERLRPRRHPPSSRSSWTRRFQQRVRFAGPRRRRLVPNGRRRRDLAATPVRLVARDGPVTPAHPLRGRRRDDPEEHRLRRHLVADWAPHGRPALHGRRSRRRQPPLSLDLRAILEELRRRNDVGQHRQSRGTSIS